MNPPRLLSVFLPLVLLLPALAQGPVIVDHRHADVTSIPPPWVTAAKANLHIAYGHTSHGSQLVDGMTGLVTFTGGVGGPQFDWNDGGIGGALDLHDRAMSGDVGNYPQWTNETRAYLDDPANAAVNVIIWAWCGQISTYTAQDVIDKYLVPMNQLEIEYPHVTFVYMTGHLSYSELANTTARNQQVRDYCIANDKVLYDFADIESYDPDGVYYAFANDNCDYWNGGGAPVGNWALDWQGGHVQGVDWYQCPSAHSQPLNANQKAYAAWWLWARLAGWSGEALDADRPRLSAATGGTVQFRLDAGPVGAGRPYFLFGSTSTQPGVPLPIGPAVLPLNYDWFTHLVMGGWNTPMFADFCGHLDASGRAGAQLVTGPIPAVLAGSEFHFAYLLMAPVDFASNPVALLIEY